MTNYHVLCCLLHKMTRNKENDAVLWLSSFLTRNQPGLMEAIKESAIFRDVQIFQEIDYIYSGVKKPSKSAVDEEIKNIEKNIDKKVAQLNTYRDIYICQDVHSLGIFLNLNGIKYNFFEDGCGTLSNTQLCLTLIKESNPVLAEIVKKLKCQGESENVVSRYGDLSEQVRGYFNKKDIDFSVKKTLKILDEAEIKRVLKVFGCKKYQSVEGKKNLLLTWAYYDRGLMTLRDERYFFSLLIDYFTNEGEILFVKPHPSDCSPNYKEWFPDAFLFEKDMPSELLPFCIDGKFHKGITNWSTSILSLKEGIDEIINFDKSIDYVYRDFHKYYVIIKLLNIQKKTDCIKKINLTGINRGLFYQLQKKYFIGFNKFYKEVEKGGDVYIVDKYKEEYDGKKCIVVDKGANSEFDSVIRISLGDRNEQVYLYGILCDKLSITKDLPSLGFCLKATIKDRDEYITDLEAENKQISMILCELKESSKKEVEEKDLDLRNCKDYIKALENEINIMKQSISWKVTKPLRKVGSIRQKRK